MGYNGETCFLHTKLYSYGIWPLGTCANKWWYDGRGALPWNADWELEMTEECWMTGETERDEGTVWGEEGGCWPGPISNGWLTWAALSEGEDGGRDEEENEEEASTGPCTKSLNSSSSSGKAGGREWEVTEEWDGDESAKTKQESETDTTHIMSYDHTTDWKNEKQFYKEQQEGIEFHLVWCWCLNIQKLNLSMRMSI